MEHTEIQRMLSFDVGTNYTKNRNWKKKRGLSIGKLPYEAPNIENYFLQILSLCIAV